MTFVLLLPRDNARAIFKLFSPALGVPLAERSYGDDCRFYTPERDSHFANFKDAFYDVHTVAHLVGWFGKMLVLRDFWMAWALSILFEWCEFSLEHILPNFIECWWDHALLDLFGCNFFGMLAGYAIIIIYDMPRFNWVKNEKTNKFVLFDNSRRFWLVVLYIAFMLAVDVNNFFLKSVLWIEAESELLKFRVAIWGFCGLAATAEYNEMVEGKKIKDMPFVSLAFYTCAVEIAIWLKFFPHMGYKMERNHPNYVYMDYAVLSFVVVGALTALLFGKNEQIETNEAKEGKKKIEPSPKQD